MMSKKSPQLRFEGFTDDWEDRKLKDVTERVRSNDGRMDLPTLTMSASSGWLDQKDRFSGDISGKEKKNYTLLKKGELSYNHGNSKLAKYGVVFSLTNYEEALVPRVYHSFKALENTSADFIEYMFSTKLPDRELGKLVSSGARMDGLLNINYDDFMNIHISIPNYEEQILVSAFFRKLDETIALHQRKLDLLKEQKKGYLQKMFPKNGAKVPELRFAGFADDWEDRKLSSIAERVTRKNKNNESTLPLTISAQDGLVDQNDYFNKQVASRDVTGYFLVKNGEFAYNKSYSNGYPWGAIKRLDKYEMGVLSTLYIVFKPTAINSQFLVSYYETTRWYREVSKNAAEGARNHGLLNISPNDFFNTLLTIPKSAEEQQQIGSFFKQLDDTIALHQRKLDLLKEQKKGFLQKMFV